MKINNRITTAFSLQTMILFLFISIFIACNEDDIITDTVEESTVEEVEDDTTTVDDSDFEATDWTADTHSKSADPNFAEVFDNTTVKRFDFVISEENWQLMLDDMTELYGTFGSSSGGLGVGGGPGGVTSFSDEDPIFVPGSVFYNGK